MTKVGEDVEKRESFYIISENVNFYSHYGKQYEGFSKTKTRTAIWSSNPFCTYLMEIKSLFWGLSSPPYSSQY